jgi:hypothetical protein
MSVFATGGDRFDDFELLRQDPGSQKLGLKVPSAEAARFFVNAFHEEERLQVGVGRRFQDGRGSSLRLVTEELRTAVQKNPEEAWRPLRKVNERG